MKIYIAGPITGHDDYKMKFAKTKERLQRQGHTIMSPTILPAGFEYDEYMKVCLGMVDVCEAVYFQRGWEDSKGALIEFEHAARTGKHKLYEAE